MNFMNLNRQKQKLILIVDDSWVIRQYFIKILSINKNYKMLEAGNGEEAFEQIKKYSPDCIILDLLMPVMNGIDLMIKLNENKITIPIICLSADVQITTKKKCKELGAFDFINKPP